jgi:hypothetical protein
VAEQITINYDATPTLALFHESAAMLRLILGPVGSGKSTGCVMDMLEKGLPQAPMKDGWRRTRWLVGRNTYRELLDTTIKTWLYWLGPLGKLNENKMEWICRIPSMKLEIEVLFRALDRPDDVKKLLSLELTGAWINEAREWPLTLIDALEDRVGRFPPKQDGGCTWRGIIMDSNPPDEDHWIYRLYEENRVQDKFPKKFAYFRQPGGVIEVAPNEFVPNPNAENLENLETDYYATRMAGKNPDYVRVYYGAQYGFVREGKPVMPEYTDAVHCAQQIIPPVPAAPSAPGAGSSP